MKNKTQKHKGFLCNPKPLPADLETGKLISSRIVKDKTTGTRLLVSRWKMKGEKIRETVQIHSWGSFPKRPWMKKAKLFL